MINAGVTAFRLTVNTQLPHSYRPVPTDRNRDAIAKSTQPHFSWLSNYFQAAKKVVLITVKLKKPDRRYREKTHVYGCQDVKEKSEVYLRISVRNEERECDGHFWRIPTVRWINYI